MYLSPALSLVHFSSRWYLHTWKSLYTLQPISLKFPQYYLWKSSRQYLHTLGKAHTPYLRSFQSIALETVPMLVTLVIILSHLSLKQLIPVKKEEKKKRKTYVTLTSPLLHTHSHTDTDTGRHTDTETQTHRHTYTHMHAYLSKTNTSWKRKLQKVLLVSSYQICRWERKVPEPHEPHQPVPCHRLTGYQHIYNQDTDNEPCVSCHRLTGYLHMHIVKTQIMNHVCHAICWKHTNNIFTWSIYQKLSNAMPLADITSAYFYRIKLSWQHTNISTRSIYQKWSMCAMLEGDNMSWNLLEGKTMNCVCHTISWQHIQASTWRQDNELCVPHHKLAAYPGIYLEARQWTMCAMP